MSLSLAVLCWLVRTYGYGTPGEGGCPEEGKGGDQGGEGLGVHTREHA